MGRYSTVYSDLWTDEGFLNLGDKEKLAFIYAMTSPLGNQAGFYKLPPSYAGLALKTDDKETIEILTSLSAKQMIRYDKKTETILVPNYLKFNPAKSVNQYKGLNSCIKPLALSGLHVDFIHSVGKYCPDAIHYLDPKIVAYVKVHFKDDGSAKGALIGALLNIYSK